MASCPWPPSTTRNIPLALEQRGGWRNRDSAHWFADYAHATFRALDDRVPLWATLNEPWVVTVGGHLNGGTSPRAIGTWPRPPWSATTCCGPTARPCRPTGPTVTTRSGWWSIWSLSTRRATVRRTAPLPSATQFEYRQHRLLDGCNGSCL